MDIHQKPQATKAKNKYGEIRTLCTLVRMQNGIAAMENGMAVLQKSKKSKNKHRTAT